MSSPPRRQGLREAAISHQRWSLGDNGQEVTRVLRTLFSAVPHSGGASPRTEASRAAPQCGLPVPLPPAPRPPKSDRAHAAQQNGPETPRGLGGRER